MPRITPRIRLRRPAKGMSGFAPRSATVNRLTELRGVSDNPGGLTALQYVPEGVKPGAPLVVVLHGCTQDAAVYDHGSGWSQLADRHDFALLYPEQSRANNPMLCFNWFSAGDSKRGMGEAASIRAMIDAMKRAHGIDPARVFVTGLSAGGAMASVMLATYPEAFAGGAIVAGVAYGCADSVGEAFDCMGGRARTDAAALAQSVRRASPHKGPWPRVQVWQGSADTTVVSSNADAIALQWAGIHGLDPRPTKVDRVEGYPRQSWIGADGEALIEQYTITGMAHGVPIGARGEDAVGQAGAHMLEVGLSSTQRIADFFGIAPEEGASAKPAAARSTAAKAAAKPKTEGTEAQRAARPARRLEPEPAQQQATGPQAVIEKALRAAGLMR